MKASIIICTYNGSKRIKQTFESLMLMILPPELQWEIIVVDNNSSDNTRDVILDFKRSSRLNVQYLFESRQGLAHARNKGVTEANGDIVVFTDDDCIVDKHWLGYILKEFSSDTTLAGLGGRVELYNKKDKPVTIRTFKERRLFSKPHQLFNLLPGCNMAFKRKVFDMIGHFDPHFGAGTRIAAAEDSDFFYRVQKAGFKMIYSPDPLIYHNHGRTTVEQIIALNRGYVIGRGAFYFKYILRGDFKILVLAFREILLRAKKIIKNILEMKSIRRELMFYYYLLTGMRYYIKACRQSEG